MDRKRLLRSPLLWVGVAFLVYLMYSYLADDTRGYAQEPTSVAVAQLNSGNVSAAVIDDKEQRVRLTLKNPVDGSSKIYAQYPDAATDDIFKAVQAAKPTDNYNVQVTSESALFSLLIYLIPIGLIILFLLWMMNNAQGGGNKVLSFGKSKAKLMTKDMPQTKFTDVAGADEAVEELDEIRDFLQNPARYQALGAKIPKGVLLYGPPGTGKTLLARAVAGEAGVPFYSISGSDFVEMFVGVGASRVRDLFEQAKANSPAIIFVDEIDAVGRHRGAGMGGGHDEREQTLNQLLVEMDGFDVKGGVILIAATNRPDILDPALLRPGRFDRQIPVGQPDLKGRQAILAVHAKGKPFAPDVEFLPLAKRTVGMSGADLANVINEAALLTARTNGTMITNAALEESVDRVVGGPARKGKIISEREKKITAYHEGGHALAAWAMPDLEPVYKVTIMPRGRTGGHALVVPEDDKSIMTRSEMIARLVMAMGGRAAEELVFAEPTTGASSDIAQATKIARAMVTEYGMSARLGAVKYGSGDDEPFLGRTYGHNPDYSIEVGAEIDGEVRALIEAAHTEAWSVLNEYRDILDNLATKLLERETLERKDLQEIFAGVSKRPRITTFDQYGERPPSDRPPIKTPGELAIERGEPWPPEPVLVALPVGPNGHPGMPVPVGAPAPYPPPGGFSAQPYAPVGAPGNWAGGVIPGPLAPMPGWPPPPVSGGQQVGAGPNGQLPYGGPGTNGHGYPTNGNGANGGGANGGYGANGANGSRHRAPDGREPGGPVDLGKPPTDPWAPGWIESVKKVSSARAPFDQARAEAAVRELLIACGEDVDRDGLRETPVRVARAFAEQFSGLYFNPDEVLNTSFDENHAELVLVRDIPMYSTCEHHLVPFFGMAHVGYIPGRDGRITGLSKLARVVEGYSKRPQVQERLTTQVAEALVRRLEPAGVIVVIEAEHLCMAMRGIRKPGATTTTSAVRGIFQSRASTRAEAMSLIMGR